MDNHPQTVSTFSAIDFLILLKFNGKKKRIRSIGMKKRFAIPLIVLIGWLVSVSLSSCHKPVTSQTGTPNDLRTPPVEVAVPEGMVLIPAGEFQIGSNDKEADNNEQPVRTVYIDAFYMDKTEVTNAEYKAFLIANPYWQKSHVVARFHSGYYLQQASYREEYDFQQVKEPLPPDVDYLHDWNGINYPTGKGNHPVTFVNWYAAVAYAEWAGKRLPTEAEWEYAARGGLVGKKYPHGDTITTRDANYNGPASWEDKYTTEVGSYPANGYGLYDMAGNVYEWCLDEYDSDFYATFPPSGVARNPVAGPNSVVRLMRRLINMKGYRVLRGGSWESSLQNIRVAKRIYNPPFSLAGVAGFRCVKDVSP